MKIISLFLQKGGVGKSTMTLALAYELAKSSKTLLIDSDTQGSITAFLTSKYPKERTLLEVLKENITVGEAAINMRPTNIGLKGFYLLGTRAEDELIKFQGDGFREDPELIEIIIKQAEAAGFQYVLFDLPPSLDFFERMVVKNCDLVLPIVEPEDASIEQFRLFNAELLKVKRRYAEDFASTTRLIVNKINRKKDVHLAYLELLNKKFDCYEFIDSKIVSKAINQKMAVQEFDPSNKMSKQLTLLAYNIIHDIERVPKGAKKEDKEGGKS